MIRPATSDDAAALAAIYNHYIRNTTISFEEEEVDAPTMAQRIGKVVAAGLPWLVLEEQGKVLGYAYATKWRERSAYRFSVESSVYLDATHAGKGLGLSLYAALMAALEAQDLHSVIAGIALPNAASVGLHERLGFRKVALFSEVGRKFGQWIDVGYWQKPLRQP